MNMHQKMVSLTHAFCRPSSCTRRGAGSAAAVGRAEGRRAGARRGGGGGAATAMRLAAAPQAGCTNRRADRSTAGQAAPVEPRNCLGHTPAGR